MIKIHSIKRWLSRTYQSISFFLRITLPEYFIRGKRGWGNSDTWSLDWYLSNVIKETVSHLKDNTHGYPCDLKNPKQWGNILKKIIWTFDIAKEMSDNFIYVPTKNWSRKKYNTTKEQFKNDKYTHIMTKKECLKYEEGWMLFQKYFNNLWD